MKRKLFSAILFGALLTASTSGLTSCKDYDDDISNLQSQIDKLATADQLSAKVSEMQAAIAAAQSAAESKAAAAQTVADAASKAADAAAAAASKAQSTADAAAAAAAEVQKAADKAIADLEAKAATKDELKAAADAAAAAVKAIEDAHAADKAAIEKAIADGLAEVKAEIAKTNEELAKLAARLDAVETKLAALEAGEGQEEALKEIQEEVDLIADALEDIIGEYTTMVTSVSLYTSGAGLANYRNGLPDKTLNFIYVDEEKDTKFPVDADVADAQIEFSSKNTDVTTKDSLVLRVSPTNAILNPENITLINSQGRELSDLIEVESVKPFNQLITRSDEGNGLWNVVFKVKEGVAPEDLVDAVAVKRGDNYFNIMFAAAVNNTGSVDNRRVISAYDVEVKSEEYEPASNNVLVTNRDGVWKEIKNLRNRYQYVAATGKSFANAIETGATLEGVTEYRWKNEPQVAGGSGKTLATAPGNDMRYTATYKLLDVAVGEDINISVATSLVAGQPSLDNNHNATAYGVKGFYVTLDKDFAIESNPSEWNAWKKYSYSNVGIPGTDTKAKLFYGNNGVISIDDEDAIGDIIGFRVYVVNLDGTLVDPDGRAFYVQVDKEKEEAAVTAEALTAKLRPIQPWDSQGIAAFQGSGNSNYLSEVMPINAGLFAGTDIATISTAIYADPSTPTTQGKWKVVENPTVYGNNSIDPVYGTDYEVIFMQWNDWYAWGGTQTNVPANANYAQVKIKEPQKFLDGGTYTVKTTLVRNNGTEVRDLVLSFTKEVPSVAPALSWNGSFDATKQIFANVTADPADIYKLVNRTVQAIDLSSMITNLNYGAAGTASKYKVTFNDVKHYYGIAPWNGKQTLGYGDTPTDYILQVQNYDIDGKSHVIDYKYDYGKISLTFDYQTAQYSTPAKFEKSGSNTLAMTFASWIDYEQIDWAAGAPTITYNPGGIPTTPQTINIAATATKRTWRHSETGTEFESNLAASNTSFVVTKVGNGETNGFAVGDVLNATQLAAIWSKLVETTPAVNALKAWNTVVPNYQLIRGNQTPVFGVAAAKTNFYDLIGNYVTIIGVSFSNSAFTVALNGSDLEFTQVTTTANPSGQTGVLNITGADCFGHLKTWSVNVKIQ